MNDDCFIKNISRCDDKDVCVWNELSVQIPLICSMLSLKRKKNGLKD